MQAFAIIVLVVTIACVANVLHHDCCNHGVNVSTIAVAIMAQMSPLFLLQSWCKCLHRNCCNHGANVSTVIVAIMVQMSPPLLLCWVKYLAFLFYLPPRLSRGSYFKCHLQLHFTLVQQSTSTIFFGLKINIFGSSLVCVEINILYLIWSLKLKLCLLFDVEPGARW